MATDKDQFAHMFEYHRRMADEYAVRSHETWNRREVGEGYSALSEAHNQFALICGKLAGGGPKVKCSRQKGE